MTDRERTDDDVQKVIAAIARQHLRIATLEVRNYDSLDFHEVSVVDIRDALRAAYEAGQREGRHDHPEAD